MSVKMLATSVVVVVIVVLVVVAPVECMARVEVTVVMMAVLSHCGQS